MDAYSKPFVPSDTFKLVCQWCLYSITILLSPSKSLFFFYKKKFPVPVFSYLVVVLFLFSIEEIFQIGIASGLRRLFKSYGIRLELGLEFLFSISYHFLLLLFDYVCFCV